MLVRYPRVPVSAITVKEGAKRKRKERELQGLGLLLTFFRLGDPRGCSAGTLTPVAWGTALLGPIN